MTLKAIYRTMRDACIVVIKWIMFLIPKDKNLILFNAWFGSKYADNTMFEYEFLLKENAYKVIWVTKDRAIYEMLTCQKKPVVMADSLKGIWKQVRAKMLVSTIQLADYNHFFLCNCIFLDLDHGIAYKQDGYDIDPLNKYREKHETIVKKYVKYYMTTPSYLTMKMTKHSYHIPEENIILCGKPRLDYFFDEALRSVEGTVIDELAQNRKVITYMPTHRSEGRKELRVGDIFDLDFIEELCEKNNYIFMIRKHFYHKNEKEKLEDYKHIIDITGFDIDTQDLLFKTDALITDYSSTFIDYILLDKPVILFGFDKEEFYKSERECFIPFEKLDMGYMPTSTLEMNRCLVELVNSASEKYREKRETVKQIFFDDTLKIGKARQEILEVITSLMKGEYKQDWAVYSEKNNCNMFYKELAENIENMKA